MTSMGLPMQLLSCCAVCVSFGLGMGDDSFSVIQVGAQVSKIAEGPIETQRRHKGDTSQKKPYAVDSYPDKSGHYKKLPAQMGSPISGHQMARAANRKTKLVRYRLMDAINEAMAGKLKANDIITKALALKKYGKPVEFEWKVEEVEAGSFASLTSSSSCIETADGAHKCLYQRDDPKKAAIFNLTMGGSLDSEVLSHSEIDVQVGLMKDKADVWCPVCGESCTFKLMGMSQTVLAAPCPVPAGSKLFSIPIAQVGSVSIPIKAVTSIRTTILRDERVIVKYIFTVRT